MENVKKYNKLILPSDSAWERKTIRKYLPIWFNSIIDGISNIFKWIPVLYKDRNYDHFFIFEILKFKLLQQRNHLVNANRHTSVDSINKYITISLNLIERIQNEYYGMEYMVYCEEEIISSTSENFPNSSTIDIETISENFNDYFNKYRNKTKLLLKKDSSLITDKKRLAVTLANHNQKRCQDLLFKILNEKINHWWD